MASRGGAEFTPPLNLLARRPKKLAAVALANKMARIIWAILVSGEVYRRPQQA
jgi:transposase